MKILILYGVYEAEKSIATGTLEQLGVILAGHEIDVLVLDDASLSHIGDQLVGFFAGRWSGRFDVLRLDKSFGYHAYIDRTMAALLWIAKCGRSYDYIIKTDPDTVFCRSGAAKLFEPGKLPRRGVFGPSYKLRKRDFVQIYADIFPFGFRRFRCPDGRIEHPWELRRGRPVWWAGIGIQAIARGFRDRIICGCFTIIAGPTLADAYSRGWLERQRDRRTGLVFGDEVILTLMGWALGDPVLDPVEVMSEWSAEIFVRSYEPNHSLSALRQRGCFIVHPLKDEPWANGMREGLPMQP